MADGGSGNAPGETSSEADKWETPESFLKNALQQFNVSGCSKSVKIKVKKEVEITEEATSKKIEPGVVIQYLMKCKDKWIHKVNYLTVTEEVYNGQDLEILCSAKTDFSAAQALKCFLEQIKLEKKHVDVKNLPLESSRYKQALEISLQCLVPVVRRTNNEVDIYYDSDDDQLLLVGITQSVKTLYKDVKDKLNKEFQDPDITKEHKLESRSHGELMMKLDCKNYVNQNLPVVKMDIDLDNNRVLITGKQQVVDKCVEVIDKFIHDVKMETVELQKEMMLLKEEDTCKYIEEKLRKENVKCHWKVCGSKIQVFSTSLVDAKQAAAVIQNCFKAEKFSLECSYEQIIHHSLMKELLERNKNKIYVKEIDGQIEVTATDDTMKEVYVVFRELEKCQSLGKHVDTSQNLDYENVKSETQQNKKQDHSETSVPDQRGSTSTNKPQNYKSSMRNESSMRRSSESEKPSKQKNILHLNVKAYKIQSLKLFGPESVWKAKYPNIDLELDETTGMIVLYADNSEECNAMISQFLGSGSMKSAKKDVPCYCRHFLTTAAVQHYVNQALLEAKHKVVWFVDDQYIRVFGDSEDVAAKSAHFIREKVVEHPFEESNVREMLAGNADFENLTSTYMEKLLVQKEEDKVVFVLTDDIAHTVIELIATWIQKAEKAFIPPRPCKMSSLQLRIAQTFRKELKDKFPDVTWKMESLEDVTAGTSEKDVMAFIENIIRNKRVVEEKEYIEFLKYPDNIEYIQNILREKGVICYFRVVDDGVEIYCVEDKVVSEFEKVIEEHFPSHCLLSDRSFEVCVESGAIREILAKYHGKAVIDFEDDEKPLMARLDVKDAIVEEIENCNKEHEMNVTYPTQDSDLLRMSHQKISYIFSKRRKEITDMQERYGVQILATDGNTNINIEGKPENVAKARKELIKFAGDNVRLAYEEFDEDKVPHSIRNKGDRDRFELSQDCKILEERVHKENPKPQFLIKLGDVCIMLVHGNIADANVDIVMCPTDFQHKPILRGRNIAEKGHLIPDDYKRIDKCLGQISIGESSGELDCPYVIHMILSRSYTGDAFERDVQSWLEKAIKLVDSNEFYSLAMPAYITDSITVSTSIQVVLNSIKKKSTLECLREIYIYADNKEEMETLKKISKTCFKPPQITDLGILFEGKHVSTHKRCMVPDIVYGCVVDQKVHVLVNTTSRDLKLDAGMVSSTLLKGAGEEISRECRDKYPNGINYREMAVTSAGQLKDNKYICHGALPPWCPTGNYSLLLMQLFMVRCLDFTDSKNLTSIAFPVIGTGNLGYPWKQVAKTMVDTVEDYWKRNGNSRIKDVKIVVWPEDKVVKQAFDHFLQVRDFQQKNGCHKTNFTGKILEARIPLPHLSVRLQIKPSVGPCLLETRIKFLSYTEVISDQKIHKTLKQEGIEEKPAKEDGKFFIDILTWTDADGDTFKKNMTKAVKTVLDNRASSLEVVTKEVKEEGKTLTIKKQANIIKSVIQENRENYYLNNVQILLSDCEKYDSLYEDLKAEVESQTKGLIANIKKLKDGVLKDMFAVVKPAHWRPVKIIPQKKIVKVCIVADAERIQAIVAKLKESPVYGNPDQPTLKTDTSVSSTALSSVMDQMFTSVTADIHPTILAKFSEKDLQMAFEGHVDKNNNGTIVTSNLWKMEIVAKNLDEKLVKRSNISDQSNKLDDFVEYEKMQISEEHRQALNFFCKDDDWFAKSGIDASGKELEIGCEKEVKLVIESKVRAFEKMNKGEVALDTKDKTKIEAAIREVHDTLPEVFCYQLQHDENKMLRIMAHDYTSVQQATHKINLILGKIKQTAGTRRNRRFEAKPMGKSEDHIPQMDDYFSSSRTRSSSGYASTSLDQSSSNFVTREGLPVKVYAGSILHLDVDCIVNAANENLQHGGGIAMVISRAAGYEFDRESRDYINNNGSLNVGECCTTSAGDLKYKGVIHTVGPRWYDYPNDQIGCLNDLIQAVKAVMIECDYQGFTKVAIPAISSGIFGVPKNLCAQQYYRAVTEYSDQDWGGSSSLTEVHFVDKDQGMVDLIAQTFSECSQKDRKLKKATVPDLGGTVKGMGSKTFSSSRSYDSTTHGKYKRSYSTDSEPSGQQLQESLTKKETESCCICMDDMTDPKKLRCGHTFCRDCIDMQFQYKPVCPSCGAVYGKIIGDQPSGTMKVTTSKYGSLQGYEGCGIITIQYYFPPGKQGPDHPQPGQPYEGISRGAYLPNNERGKLVCDLLKIAFDRKLVFTIGRSRTTGKEGVVTWNDIHHKTRMDGGPPRFGYPDPTYLDRVMEELEVKGVTEESLNDP